jgi:hypothetical protein
MEGLSEKTVARDGIFYVVSDGQIIRLPTRIDDKIESERSRIYLKGKAVPLHATKALGGEEV